MTLQATVLGLALLLLSGGPPSPAAREVRTLDVCAHVPLAQVARILDRDAARGTAQATMGQWSADCTYSFERDGSHDSAMVWVYPPELWAPAGGGDAERIEGLGDEAFAAAAGSLAKGHVLLEGDLYIDTRAASPEAARDLAELALERLARGSVED